MKRWLAALTTTALCASSVAAQPATPAADRAAAKALFARGTTHFNVAEYDAAIAAFKESYKLAPLPVLLYNIAQAYRHKGDCDEARRFYRSYLREAPDAANRAKVERFIAEMEACVAARPAAPPPDPAPPSAPAAPPAPAVPAPDPAPMPPPPPTLDPDGAALRDPPAATVDRGRGLRVGGLVAAGIGAGAVGAGVALSLHARSLGRDLEASCADGCSADEVLAQDRRGADAERNATIAYAVGGVAIAAGLGVYVVGRSRRATRETPAVGLAPLPEGGVMLVVSSRP